MVHESYQDPISVVASFRGEQVAPLFFYWGKHKYQVNRILNVHSTFAGRERLHCFSVATETEFFRLAFHTEDMKWVLIEHYQDS